MISTEMLVFIDNIDAFGAYGSMLKTFYKLINSPFFFLFFFCTYANNWLLPREQKRLINFGLNTCQKKMKEGKKQQ